MTPLVIIGPGGITILAAGTTPDCGPHCPEAAGELRGEPHCDRACCHGRPS